MQKIAVFWFRRDMRLEDNAGLYHALKSGRQVLPVFIFDKNILDKLEDEADARVGFIHQTLWELREKLQTFGAALKVLHGSPPEIWKQLVENYPIEAVYTNHDYEPYAVRRDAAVQQFLQQRGISFHTFKDHVVFEKEEISKPDGSPYVVFTPYSRKWKETLLGENFAETGRKSAEKQMSENVPHYPSEDHFEAFLKTKPFEFPSLEQIGFKKSAIAIPPKTVAQGIIRNYDQTRDFPALNGTSKLGIHFRFGTISIREKAKKALLLNQTFLNELIWRDFYSMILSNFPRVVNEPFRKEYANIAWLNNPRDFEKWCAGETGYPIVDAGMRELNTTSYMHNRVRMITASFLTKHLLIDWRWGEAYFAQKLLDFDLASNNGGWQWAAGCGTDAAPYFRIFNPDAQTAKFDKELTYVKKWAPEYGTARYAKPIVEHKFARERCLEFYKKGLEMKV